MRYGVEMSEENASYLSLHCPSDCLLVKKKITVQCMEPWQYLGHLESLSYCPEIANQCFLSYILKNKKRLPISKTPETAGC